MLAPFGVAPDFVTRIWGTSDLRPWFDHVTGRDEEPIGEVWLTSDKCRAMDGPMAGKTLAEVFEEQPLAMLGMGAPSAASPLLVKVLFAREKLSVQVHPDDVLARKYGEPRGKTECWYALAANGEARVALGLVPGTTIDQLEAGVADHTLEAYLEDIPVEAGDMIAVDAGTVHAIWPGSVLLETQQYSDLTYRLYDYGRPRPLHLEKGMEAVRFETGSGKVAPRLFADRTVLIDRQYFCVEKMVVDGVRSGDQMRGADEPVAGLAYLFAARGTGRIVPDREVGEAGFVAVELKERGLVAVPAAAPAWRIEAAEGGIELIRITPRWPTTAAEAAGRA